MFRSPSDDVDECVIVVVAVIREILANWESMDASAFCVCAPADMLMARRCMARHLIAPHAISAANGFIDTNFWPFAAIRTETMTEER